MTVFLTSAEVFPLYIALTTRNPKDLFFVRSFVPGSFRLGPCCPAGSRSFSFLGGPHGAFLPGAPFLPANPSLALLRGYVLGRDLFSENSLGVCDSFGVGSESWRPFPNPDLSSREASLCLFFPLPSRSPLFPLRRFFTGQQSCVPRSVRTRVSPPPQNVVPFLFRRAIGTGCLFLTFFYNFLEVPPSSPRFSFYGTIHPPPYRRLQLSVAGPRTRSVSSRRTPFPSPHGTFLFKTARFAGHTFSPVLKTPLFFFLSEVLAFPSPLLVYRFGPRTRLVDVSPFPPTVTPTPFPSTATPTPTPGRVGTFFHRDPVVFFFFFFLALGGPLPFFLSP